MKTLKRLQFWQEPTAGTAAVHAQLVDTVWLLEDLQSVEYPIATWPAALVLAAYLAQHPDLCRGKRVLELGAGTALPSVLCARPSIGAAAVFASERPEETDLLHLMARTIELNACSARCSVLPLDWRWDATSLPPELCSAAPIDVILGADVFYCDDDFAVLFRLLHRLFTYHPHAIFLTSYHVRQAQRVVWPWLVKYALVAEEVPTTDVLAAGHRLGVCLVQQLARGSEEATSVATTTEAAVAVEELAVPTFADVHLYVIRRRTDADADTDADG